MEGAFFEVGAIAFGKFDSHERADDEKRDTVQVDVDPAFFGIFGHKVILTVKTQELKTMPAGRQDSRIQDSV